MAHIVVLGGGAGGISCAYELKDTIRKEDRVSLFQQALLSIHAVETVGSGEVAVEGRHHIRSWSGGRSALAVSILSKRAHVAGASI